MTSGQVEREGVQQPVDPRGECRPCSGPDGGARFLWLLPVHRSEADSVATESVGAFEEILEADRPPLV